VATLLHARGNGPRGRAEVVTLTVDILAEPGGRVATGTRCGRAARRPLRTVGAGCGRLVPRACLATWRVQCGRVPGPR